MNFKAGELLSFKFLNHIDNNLSIGEWNTVIEDNFEEFEKIPASDLISQKNWSYGPQEQIFLNKRAHNIKDVVINNIMNYYNYAGTRVVFENNEYLKDV